ncbi:isochorismatase family protein [Flexivirga caeni]|uniref:Isochorismatase family protein n=1 Tax=Flexivirga caeni TaxID=2294115 RepID=A0A3M9MIB8_9MICO|nr:isochorismatase family protein [Flexivirga caeni]RNI25319.1 isochorismatase family protein [Flexivirga caeni]
MCAPPQATALIVVDMQAGFVDGDCALPQMPTVVPAVRQQLESARTAGALVIFLQNDGSAGAIDEPETPGWELVLDLRADDVLVRKQHDSGFAGTDLAAILKRNRVETISICGVMSEMCVAAAARDAMERGFTVVLAHDSHGTYPVPAYADGERAVSAIDAARAAEWSLGDGIHIPPRAVDVQFGAVLRRQRVAALIQRDGLLLVVRHRARGRSGRHDGELYLTPPGGSVEPSEALIDALTREVKEEVNLVVSAAEFVTCIEHTGGSTTLFETSVEAGDPVLGVDPELECDCPVLVGLDWIPAPPTESWSGPVGLSQLSISVSAQTTTGPQAAE